LEVLAQQMKSQSCIRRISSSIESFDERKRI
jgi:hypothetical protein